MRRGVLEIVGVVGSTIHLDVELPETTEDYLTGMSGRMSSGAMYFRYPAGARVSMTTRAMRFPIWIAFVDGLHVVRHITRYMPGMTTPVMDGIYGVLELPAREGEIPPVTIGSRVRSIRQI